MAPAPWTVCKYYLSGKCNRPRCKYRHAVPGLVVVSQLPPPEREPTHAMALLIDEHIKATFAAGIVPVTVEDMHSSKLGLRIQSVNTSVTIELSQSTRTLCLQYNSHSVAFRAYSKLVGARLVNVTLHCALDESNQDGVFILKVLNVPWRISEDMILSRLPNVLRLEKKDISIESTRKPSLPVISGTVARITKLNPICIKECYNKPARKVKLWFVSQRLDGVARLLEERPPQFGGSRIKATEMVEVHLRLDLAIYQRYRGLLKSCANSIQRYPKCNVHFEENKPAETHVQLIISGTDRQVLMAAKSALDKLLIRNTVGRLSPLPKSTVQSHRIVLAKTSNLVNAIEGGGLRRAQDLLGALNVYLDTVSTPAAIVVWGDTCALREVQRCLSSDGSLRPDKTSLCEICWDGADDNIRVQGCHHVACKKCFVHYCTLVRDNKFPLQCFQTDCKTLLLVSAVRKALGEQAFHHLGSEALEAHFKQDPATYIKCPGPDCKLYFSASDGETNICPGCFTTSCSNCRAEYHFGESCSQYKERMLDSDKKFEEWMEKEGAKHCPNCNGVVQKIAGCNHMTCPLCGQHFCFECLDTFETGPAVYEHMGQLHRRWYANELEREEANEHEILQALNDVEWRDAVQVNEPDEPFLDQGLIRPVWLGRRGPIANEERIAWRAQFEGWFEEEHLRWNVPVARIPDAGLGVDEA